jgi:membrane protease YdiL (CAAX protease family)
VHRRPLLHFFALAYAVSWLAWTPYILSEDGFAVLPLRFPQLLGDTQLAGILPGAYLGPLLAAFLVTVVTEGADGVRSWRARLFRWRVGTRWYAFALVAAPISTMLATLALPGGEDALRLPPLTLLLAYVPLLVVQYLTSGLAEEPGWRDFALPRLQHRHGTLVLGVLWTGWHLPLFLTSWGGGVPDPTALAQFTVVAIALSVVITWVFNRAQQSVPVIMLLHATFNNFLGVALPEFFPGLDPRTSWGPALGAAVLAIVLIAVTQGRLGYTGAPRLTTRSPAAPSAPRPSGA